MSNIAILVGNTEYQTLGKLECCGDDVAAMKELLEATEKFDSIEVILDSASSDLKDRIRDAIDANKPAREIFFYFTGHGFQHQTEFFYCATNFDSKRPNETGLSNSELHTLLRSSDADLVVKVIDACSSGTLLVKSEDPFQPTSKQGFKNLIQIASCLDSQNSLTGDPLSFFTEKFRAATLRKTEGTVYYTDVIDALRDEFLENNNQTPHFVSQGTGREQFVDNAKRLGRLRSKLSARTDEALVALPVAVVGELQANPLDALQRAQDQFAKKELAQRFISQLFDKLSEIAPTEDSFKDLFSTEIVVHADFVESTTRAFIIRVLSNEKRPDNFVTAAAPRRDALYALGLSALSILTDPDTAVADYVLRLNCQLDEVQLKITLTPKFLALKRFELVVSCAPSLEVCYVMEMLTKHSLRDWGVYDSGGAEVVRRWYKQKWTGDAGQLAEQMWTKTKETVQESVDAALQSLTT